MVTFKRKNLQDNLNSLGSFDLILCRNVAIYFEEHFKRDLFTRLAHILFKDGRLMLGGTETLLSHQDLFQPEQIGGSFFYRKNLKPTSYQPTIKSYGQPTNPTRSQ